MNDMLIPITMFIAAAVVLWKFIDSRQKVRTMALEKGSIDENMKYLFGSQSKPNRFAALKWGLAALFIGVALLLSIPLQAFSWAQIHQGELITGLIFTGGGLAFLMYYMIVAKAERSEDA
ncbi:MAG: hypothetical protein IH600_05805 [Bacteroidetes bacterium]|nr:hypothetical protein [Bacteroidota bacterium]